MKTVMVSIKTAMVSMKGLMANMKTAMIMHARLSTQKQMIPIPTTAESDFNIII